MTDPEPATPRRAFHASHASPGDAPPSGPVPSTSHAADTDGRIGALRGASVQFDARRLVRVVVGLVMATLAVLIVVLMVAGIHTNDQTDRLHTQGRHVTVTVTQCLGLLGGSGSNAAGYSCRGVYSLDGHTYDESLPGSSFYAPGTKVAALAVPGDPALVSPLAVIDTQHSSASVFVLPAVLAGVLVLLVLFLVWRYRPGRRDDAAAAGAAGPGD